MSWLLAQCIGGSLPLLLLLLSHFLCCVSILQSSSSTVEVVYDSPNSRCHQEGRAYQCMPPFTNIAEGVKPQVSSQCGLQPATEETICEIINGSSQTGHCVTCNAQQQPFHANYLTDKNISGNETCWLSASDIASTQPVNISLAFGKRFEVYYISLQPCGPLPDSIAVYKSANFGSTWTVWQYFSTDCPRAFGLPTSHEQSPPQISAENLQQVLCVALKPIPVKNGRNVYSEAVIAFSTTFGRPSMQPWSAALIDWMTMTNIKIVLTRFPDKAPPLPPPAPMPPASVRMPGGSGEDAAKKASSPTQGRFTAANLYYGFSDIAVGGRCKCNGHASRCIRENNELRCDCQHNTDGVDCERCKESFLDQPWQRATVVSANVCKKCDCNLHTDSCKFSQEVYLMSGQTSGGICHDCQHNTAGRKCHYCSDGYYRDWTMPLSHEHVCIKCRCHPIGSKDFRLCDKKTGQCQCKDGVAGQFCDRCVEGYKQTQSPVQPCSPDQNCKPCNGMTKRIRFKKFCRKHLVIQGTVLSSQTFGDYVRYEMRMHFVWRRDSVAWFVLPMHSIEQQSVQPVWMKVEDMMCKCPELQAGVTYLLITNVQSYYNKGFNELLLTHNSLALPWQEAWKRRLLKFKKREMRGNCQKFSHQANTRINKEKNDGANGKKKANNKNAVDSQISQSHNTKSNYLNQPFSTDSGYLFSADDDNDQ